MWGVCICMGVWNIHECLHQCGMSLWCVLVCVWSACGVGVCVWCVVCVWSVCVYSMGSLGGCEVYVYSGCMICGLGGICVECVWTVYIVCMCVCRVCVCAMCVEYRGLGGMYVECICVYNMCKEIVECVYNVYVEYMWSGWRVYSVCLCVECMCV